MAYKTCPDCGSRIFEHGCVNCNERDYISMQDDYVPPITMTGQPSSPIKEAEADVLGKEADGDILANNSKPEYVICAANWFNDGKVHVHQPKNIEIGFVVCGRRHHNCYYIASICLADGYSEIKGTTIQGFLTSKDRFLDRKESGALAYKMKQINEPTDCLFSEDLY